MNRSFPLGFSFHIRIRNVMCCPRVELVKMKTWSFMGELTELISRLKSVEGKNIYCDGGGEVVLSMLKDKLIDKMVI